MSYSLRGYKPLALLILRLFALYSSRVLLFALTRFCPLSRCNCMEKAAETAMSEPEQAGLAA
jgi:hypothetical protein